MTPKHCQSLWLFKKILSVSLAVSNFSPCDLGFTILGVSCNRYSCTAVHYDHQFFLQVICLALSVIVVLHCGMLI